MLTARPLYYVNVNNWAFVERVDLVQGNGGTYHFLLAYADGGKRYIPQAGSTIQLVFPRTQSIAATPSNQDVTVTCVQVDARDTSLYSFTLTIANVDKIVSEGAKLVVTEGGVAKTYPVDHFVRRRSNSPGA